MSRSDSIYLLPGKALQLLVALAVEIGDRHAILLQQLHYRINDHKTYNRRECLHDGKWWETGTIAQLHAREYPFWSENTIERLVADLVKMGLVIAEKSGQQSDSSRAGRPAQVWRWTINYERVGSLAKIPSDKKPRRQQPGAGRKPKEKGGQSEAEIQGGIKDNLGLIPGGNFGQFGLNIKDKLSLIHDGIKDNLGLIMPSSSYYIDSERINNNIERKTPETDTGSGVKNDDSATVPDEKNPLVVVGLLLRKGVNESEARALVSGEMTDKAGLPIPLEEIYHQARAMKHYNLSGITNPAGFLVNACRIHRALPDAYHQARARAAARHAAPPPSPPAPDERPTTNAAAALWLDVQMFEADLSPEARTRLEQETRAALSPALRDAVDRSRRDGRDIPRSVKPLWEQARREILTRWMQAAQGELQ